MNFLTRVFLSHSSKDKSMYTDIVARKLVDIFGSHRVIYDAMTFEEGMKTVEEIESCLDTTDLFVIFISNNSLESTWVIKEIESAYQLFSKNKIARIYPIIIDEKINYEDSRIPDWMRDNYNLKYVSRPTKAVQLIHSRIIEITWQAHPRLAEREKIFVGRNESVTEIETRLDDYENPPPACIIVSGVPQIGRRSFLKYCLKKANIVRESYVPMIIRLEYRQSLEDFLLYIYDLGFSKKLDLSNLMSMEQESKIQIATAIIDDIQNHSEIVIIEDRGCIVDFKGELSDWFVIIINNLKCKSKIAFGIISSYKLHRNVRNSKYFSTSLPELNKEERKGLLKRYLEFEQLSLSQSDFSFVSDLLTGYPEQIFYSVGVIKDRGINYLKGNSYLVTDYNEKQVSIVLSDYQGNHEAMEFLRLLASFDQIEVNFIFEVVGEGEFYSSLMEEYLNKSICIYTGSANEYIRVNDAIKDYIQRSEINVPKKFKDSLASKLDEFLLCTDTESYSMPLLLFSLKESLISGKKVKQDFIIPSIYLKVMAELYEKYRKYADVITFAYKALENEAYMQETIKFEIRFLLCLALAKTQNPKFLLEVEKIQGADYHFLRGFYFRHIGKPNSALEECTKALAIRRNFSKVKRELVQVYIMLQEYINATVLAKDNYYTYRDNPYHIHAYFTCLIKSEKNKETKELLEVLLLDLSLIQSEKAKEMFMRSKALFEAIYNDNEELSLELINQDIRQYPDVEYAYITKFDICEKFQRLTDMKEIITFLEKTGNRKYSNNIVGYKSIVLAIENGTQAAIDYFMTHVQNYTEEAKQTFIDRLRQKYEK